MQEECKYGERCLRLDCKYVHNIKKRSVPCVHFQANKCIKGDRCPYMHVMKTTQKQSAQLLNIDIAPVIEAEISLPVKRQPAEQIELNKEFPEDISHLLDILDEEKKSLNYEDIEARTEKIMEIANKQDSETDIMKSPRIENNLMEIEGKELEGFVFVTSVNDENKSKNHEKELEEQKSIEKEKEVSIDKNEIIEAKENIKDKTEENKDVEMIEISKSEKKANEEARELGEIIEDPGDKILEKSQDSELKPTKIDEKKIQDEVINLKKSPCVETKSDSGKTPSKSNEISLSLPKPSDSIIKVVPPTKAIPEKPIKTVPLVKSEEKVTLPLARKPPVIEKTTRILTLEEIKQKKKLEAQLKGEQKEVVEVKQVAKTSPKSKPNTKPIETLSKPTENTIKLPDPQTKPLEPQTKPIPPPIKPVETNPKPIQVIPAPTDTIQLPSKRPTSAPIPVQKHLKPSPIPLLVTIEEWEPYKQALLSLDFSSFNLSLEDIQGCKDLAKLMSTPEGVSKITVDLEQKLSSFPDIQLEPEFESLCLTEKIEKLYESLRFY